MAKRRSFSINVEEPYQEIKTISIDQAKEDYLLDDVDLDELDKGRVIRIKDIMLMKNEEK